MDILISALEKQTLKAENLLKEKKKKKTVRTMKLDMKADMLNTIRTDKCFTHKKGSCNIQDARNLSLS